MFSSIAIVALPRKGPAQGSTFRLEDDVAPISVPESAYTSLAPKREIVPCICSLVKEALCTKAQQSPGPEYDDEASSMFDCSCRRGSLAGVTTCVRRTRSFRLQTDAAEMAFNKSCIRMKQQSQRIPRPMADGWVYDSTDPSAVSQRIPMHVCCYRGSPPPCNLSPSAGLTAWSFFCGN
jgi:hypothetical protein